MILGYAGASSEPGICLSIATGIEVCDRRRTGSSNIRNGRLSDSASALRPPPISMDTVRRMTSISIQHLNFARLTCSRTGCSKSTWEQKRSARCLLHLQEKRFAMWTCSVTERINSPCLSMGRSLFAKLCRIRSDDAGPEDQWQLVLNRKSVGDTSTGDDVAAVQPMPFGIPPADENATYEWKLEDIELLIPGEVVRNNSCSR